MRRHSFALLFKSLPAFLFLHVSATPKSPLTTHLRGSLASRVLACVLTVVFVSASLPMRAFAAGPEHVESAETPTFSDSTPNAKGSNEAVGKATSAKTRTVPVSASGTFSQSIPLQVPPGRLGMTPSLGLAYDSGSTQESSVGVGWSFGVATISRSTRGGFPPVTREGLTNLGPRIYDDNGAFTGPAGELVRATDGPTGAQNVYAPLREHSPVRFEFLPADGGAWVEHDPSGKKRYYGSDPIASTRGRITNELGTHAWLLLREEDADGNYILYQYHNSDSQDRALRTKAQTQPILSRVEWGGNRKTNLPSCFYVQTYLTGQVGPVNLLEGNVALEHAVSSIEVGMDKKPVWTYVLAYERSADTGKLLLHEVQRRAPGEATETTTFRYTKGAPLKGRRFVDMGPLRDLESIYSELNAYTTKRDGFSTARATPEAVIDAPGYRSGTKFLDLDGNGTMDAIYHAAGIQTTASHVLWGDSRLQSFATRGLGDWLTPGGPSGVVSGRQIGTSLPWLRPNTSLWENAFATTVLTDLVDLDGDADADGVAFPLNYTFTEEWSGPGGGAGITPTRRVPQAEGTMRVRLHTNTAKASGVALPTEQTLSDWPFGVEHMTRILIQKDPDSPIGPGSRVQYEPYVENDFSAPLVDLNGDGKTDIVLLKHMQKWTPVAGRAYYVMREDVDRFGKDFSLESLGVHQELVGDYLPKLLGPEPCTLSDSKPSPDSECLVDSASAPLVLLSDELVFGENVHQPFEVMSTKGASFRSPQIPNDKSVFVLRGMTPPVIPRLQPIKLPRRQPVGGLPIPYLDDIWIIWPSAGRSPGGGSGSKVEAFSPGEPSYRFVPRAFLSTGASIRQIRAERTERGHSPIRIMDSTSDFGSSLANVVNGGRFDECYDATCVYQPKVNFNTFFMDANGDNLPDLVVAQKPLRRIVEHTSDSGRSVKETVIDCFDGHRVYLNRGYRWESKAGETLDENWTSLSGGGVLGRLVNRDGWCNGNSGDIQEGTVAQFPMGAMAQVDLNADGRLDVVLGLKTIHIGPGSSPSSFNRAVYLNTGRGFVEATDFDVPEVPLGTDYRVKSSESATLPPRFPKAASDGARFVDLNGDGLVDIIEPGWCIPGLRPDRMSNGGRAYFVKDCVPPKWYRNVGDLPDRLDGIDASSGAWTDIEYALPRAPYVELPEKGLRPSASSRVVRAIRSASGPRNVPAGHEPFPVQEVVLSYRNFVRDPVSTEVVGYEQVVADFRNNYRGAPRETARVTNTFDVRPEIADASGNVLPVRYPLKGAQVSSVVEASGGTETDLATFDVVALGTGVRIRSRGQQHGSKSPDGVAAWSGSESLDRDTYGNPKKLRSGNSDGTTLGPVAQVVEKTLSYEDRPAAWQIGLVTRETSRGYSEDVNGAVDLSRVLSDVMTFYTPSAAVESTLRLAVTASGCGATADDATTYDYYPNGLVRTLREVGRREVTTVYDAHQLYPARRETHVGRAVGTQFTPGATTLKIAYETDLRSGATTKVTDANGVTIQTTFDSRGRSREKRGPDGTLLEETSYVDAFPMFVQTRIHTDTGKYFDRRTDVDAAGNSLSIVEGRGTDAVPFVRTSKAFRDAFGRVVESFLPEQVTSLEAGFRAAQSGKTTTDYDGFDRPTRVLRPDGTTTSYAYEPRATTETDARGTPTRRLVDAFGQLIVVYRNPGGAAAETSSHFLVRDGLGELVRVIDGDGNVRQIERDGGGRIHLLTLPQKPGTPGGRYTLCHDLDDKLESLKSPGGRATTVVRDELGRAVRSTSIDPRGDELVTWQNYDDPAASKGLGRITAKGDASGTYGFTYDALGLPKSLTFEPSARALAGARNVSKSYAARFTYSQIGTLNRVDFDGLPSAADLTYQHDDKGRTTWVDSSDGNARQILAGEFAYDTQDRMTGVRFGNSTYGEWHYNTLSQRLDEIAYRDILRRVFSSVAYTYDANGNPLEEKRSKSGTTGFYTQKLQTFDALDRLRTADVFHPSGNRREAYAYTPGGNLLSASEETYEYDSTVTPQAVSLVKGGTEGTRQLSYDADGYLEDENSDRGGGQGRKRTVRFDGNGCLAEVAQFERLAGDREESSRSSFVCGLDGRVVGRHTESSTGETSTRIDFAGLAEIRPDEGTFLLRVPINGATAVEDARSLATGARMPQASGYIHADARGSVLAMTDFERSDVLTREAEYDAWGQTIATGLATPRHAFLNHEPVPGVGYYNFGARTYDPTLRRWLSPDPLLFIAPHMDQEIGEELNLFQYAGNNPVRNTDPNGTAAEVAPLLAGAAPATPFIILGVVAVGAVFVVNVVMTGKLGDAANRTRDTIGKVVEKANDVYNQVRSAEKTAETIKKVEEKLDSFVPAAESKQADGKAQEKAADTAKDQAKPEEGRYEFPDKTAPGKTYVGQSEEITERLKVHERKGRLTPGTESRTSVPGGKTAREVEEQKRINALGGKSTTPGSQTSNKVNPIGPKRQPQVEKVHGPIPPPKSPTP